MKWLLIALIRLYWIAVPARLRRRCVYRESCSHHVERTARESGLMAGLRALLVRYRNCRGNYRSVFVAAEKKWTLHLASGEVLDVNEISPRLRRELGNPGG